MVQNRTGLGVGSLVLHDYARHYGTPSGGPSRFIANHNIQDRLHDAGEPPLAERLHELGKAARQTKRTRIGCPVHDGAGAASMASYPKL